MPDRECALFVKASPTAFSVVPETNYLGHRTLDWVRSRLDSKLFSRSGWFLQQFIKIEAARHGASHDATLIWDADTIPLKPLEFIDEAGRFIHYTGQFLHPPHFEGAASLLEVAAHPPHCFIGQSFAATGAMFNAFCKRAEAVHGVHWIEALIALLNRKPHVSFSEYDYLGYFLISQYPDTLAYSTGRWEQYGKSLFGGIEGLNPASIAYAARFIDFASFETWDHGLKYNRNILKRPRKTWMAYKIRHLNRVSTKA